MDELMNLDDFLPKESEIKYLEPYETASNVNLDYEEGEETYINADGTVDVEVEIPRSIYTSSYVDELITDIDEIAMFGGMKKMADKLYMRFRVPHDKREEFIKKAANHGLTIRRPRDMEFEPPDDKLIELERKYGKKAFLSLFLQGFVHPSKLEEFAKSTGLSIDNIKSFQKGNKIVSTARVVGYTDKKGAAIVERVSKIANAFGGIALPLAKGVLIIGCKA